MSKKFYIPGNEIKRILDSAPGAAFIYDENGKFVPDEEWGLPED